MNRHIRPMFSYASTLIRRFFRDPVAMFFTILFPLLFLIIFGSIFGNRSSVTFEVAIIDQAQTSFSKQFVENAKKDKTFKVDNSTSKQQALEKMSKSSLDSVIVLPKEFGEVSAADSNKAPPLPKGEAIVYYDKASPEAGTIITQIIGQIFNGLNQDLTKTKPLFTVKSEAAQTNNLRPFDYVFSGLVGFSILSLGIFGLANVMPSQKQNGVLRRLRVSPFTANQLVAGTTLYYLLVGGVSIAILTLVALFGFGLEMRGNWLLFILICVLGLIMMIGFGVAIGGWARNENQAAPLSNLVAFPLMFLSGAFFPRFNMPDWLRTATDYVPLTPVIDSIRFITTEGRGLAELAPQISIIVISTIIVYAIAIKVFRWE